MAKDKKDLNQKISEEIDAYTKNRNDSVEKEIEKDVKEIFSEEIKNKVKKEIREDLLLDDDQSYQKNIGSFRGKFSQIKDCLSGICFYQMIIMSAAYLSIIVLMFSCLLFNFFFCIDRSILGSGTILSVISILSLIATLGLSFFSAKTRPALIFGLILNIPNAVLIVILTFRYIGLLILGIVFFYTISRPGRR